ncbi:MAG: hypothetical protein K9N39_11660 [Candidatus Cloacimonetes bacterium]|nr:hypothetical protein [Candidatus Cloacimonadota bacterium]
MMSEIKFRLPEVAYSLSYDCVRRSFAKTEGSRESSISFTFSRSKTPVWERNFLSKLCFEILPTCTGEVQPSRKNNVQSTSSLRLERIRDYAWLARWNWKNQQQSCIPQGWPGGIGKTSSKAAFHRAGRMTKN